MKVTELEALNLGANARILGFDSQTGKFGSLTAAQISGGVPWFGRRWRAGNSSPIGAPIGDLDLGRTFAHEIGLGGYLVQNNHNRDKLDASNHNLLKNGGAANLTGAAGHYQWGWNVSLWYQNYIEADGSFCESFSLGGPRRGMWNYRIPVGSRSAAGYAQMDRTNSILMSTVNDTAQFRGGNNTAAWDGTYRSLLGKPVTNLPIATLRTAARKNGTLWFANERVMQFITAALKRVILGTRNIQTAFNATLDANGLRQGGTGMGSDYPATWGSGWQYNPYLDLSVGVDQGDFNGILSTTIDEDGTQRTINNIPSFYGLKNDYKYLVCMSENMILQSNADGSQSLFIDDDIDGSQMDYSTVAGLRKIATGPAAAGGGWQYSKDYSMDHLAFFPKPELGGSTSTYYCDGYYNPGATSGLRGVLLLGHADYGDDAGSLFVYGDSALGGYHASWGAFLCEWAEEFSSEPVWNEKI